MPFLTRPPKRASRWFRSSLRLLALAIGNRIPDKVGLSTFSTRMTRLCSSSLTLAARPIECPQRVAIGSATYSFQCSDNPPNAHITAAKTGCFTETKASGDRSRFFRPRAASRVKSRSVPLSSDSNGPGGIFPAKKKSSLSYRYEGPSLTRR